MALRLRRTRLTASVGQSSKKCSKKHSAKLRLYFSKSPSVILENVENAPVDFYGALSPAWSGRFGADARSTPASPCSIHVSDRRIVSFREPQSYVATLSCARCRLPCPFQNLYHFRLGDFYKLPRPQTGFKVLVDCICDDAD